MRLAQRGSIIRIIGVKVYWTTIWHVAGIVLLSALLVTSLNAQKTITLGTPDKGGTVTYTVTLKDGTTKTVSVTIPNDELDMKTGVVEGAFRAQGIGVEVLTGGFRPRIRVPEATAITPAEDGTGEEDKVAQLLPSIPGTVLAQVGFAFASATTTAFAGVNARGGQQSTQPDSASRT